MFRRLSIVDHDDHDHDHDDVKLKYVKGGLPIKALSLRPDDDHHDDHDDDHDDHDDECEVKVRERRSTNYNSQLGSEFRTDQKRWRQLFFIFQNQTLCHNYDG